MGIFFKVLARKHAVSMYFGSLLREPIDQVVALSQGDNQHIFWSSFFQQQQKNCGLLPCFTATTLNFFYSPSFWWQGWAAGRRREARRQPSTFLSTFLLVTKMSCRSLPWGTATTFNFFYWHFFWWQRWAAGRRREARRRPSTFYIHLSSGDKDKLRVVAVRHGDDPQLFGLEKVFSPAGNRTPDILTTGRSSYQ